MLMNIKIDNILRHFFQKDTLEKVDVISIEELAQQYPYYAPAQYLLAKKYRQTGHSGYHLQAAKSAVFFANPHWLNNVLQADEQTATEENEFSTPRFSEPGRSAAVEELSVATDNTNVVSEKTGIPVVPEINTTEFETVPEQDIVPAEAIEANITEQSENIVTPVIEQSTPAIEENTPHAEVYNSIVEIAIENAAAHERKNSDLPAGENLNTQEPEPGEDDNVDETKALAENKGLAPLLKWPQDTSMVTGTESLVPVEPLYTIDYFASQGIKLGKEEDGKDKLSQKLKSFTEWLKTMKRIHPEKLEKEIDVQTTTTIQNIAEHSNESTDVITEAMAEVYARQGLKQKAADVYQKLSLLNPDKRAYFAAKIFKLNET